MVQQFRSPSVLTGALKAGSKDPRAIVRNVRGYDPTIQADQLQFSQQNQATQANTIPLSDAIDTSSQSFASQSRIQADYTPFPFIGDLTAAQELLIPRNTNRSNFYVINLSADTIFLSLGTVNPQLPGFPIASMGYFSETNGVIGINDIYISSGAGTISGLVLGYEGIPIIGGP